MSNYRFHFWLPAINEHESAWIKGLANRGFDVKVYVGGGVDKFRSLLGLNNVDYGRAEIIFLNTVSLDLGKLGFLSANDLHFFTGIKEFYFNRLYYKQVAAELSEAKIIYISESKDFRGLKGLARYLRDKFFDREKVTQVDAVLAMGRLGVNWFQRIGFPSSKIFEFLYCATDRDIRGDLPLRSSIYKIAFVGQLISRKNLNLLIDACIRIRKARSDFVLNIYGAGDKRDVLENIVRYAGADEFISFKGPVSNNEVRNLMLDVDLLVLPSKWDGWGAVVNEGLLAGANVLVSDMAGSSVLANFFKNCGVFRSENLDDLIRKLEIQIDSGIIPLEIRKANIANAERYLNEERVVHYILNVVEAIYKRSDHVAFLPWMNRPKVDLVYHFFPHYRAAVLEKIAHESQFRFRFIADQNSDAIDSSILPWKGFKYSNGLQLPLKKLFGKFYWQRGLVSELLRTDSECVVLLGDMNNLSLWLGSIFLRVRGIRLIFWAHGWVNSKENAFKSLVRNIFFSIPHGMLLYGRRAKRLAIKGGFDAKDIWVVYNSLDYDRQRELRNFLKISGGNNLRRELFSDENVVVFGCITRLIPLRRIDMLIEAVSRLVYSGIKSAVLLIGDGSEREKLIDLAQRKAVPIFCTGALYDEADIAKYMSIMDMAVAPGKVGLTAMHCLAYGIPVLTTNCADVQMPESEAIVDGLTGAYFIDGDIDDLTNKLLYFSKNRSLLQEMSANCVGVIENFYNPSNQLMVIESCILNIPVDEPIEDFMLNEMTY